MKGGERRERRGKGQKKIQQKKMLEFYFRVLFSPKKIENSGIKIGRFLLEIRTLKTGAIAHSSKRQPTIMYQTLK